MCFHFFEFQKEEALTFGDRNEDSIECELTEIRIWEILYTNIHSNITYNSHIWKQPKYSCLDEWIIKIWYIHTMKYYFALKRNEILIHATT